MANINKLNPHVKALCLKLIEKCKEKGIRITITQTLRTFAEQNALYAQGRTKPGKIVTNARGGQSIHNYGYAFDIAVIKNGKVTWDTDEYKKVGPIGQSIGLEWGGSWTSIKDYPHYQWTGGLSLRDFEAGRRPKGQGDSTSKTSSSKVAVTTKTIQTILNKKFGENLKVDNDFGPATKAALDKHVLKKGSKNVLVTYLQKILDKKGYNVGKADGDFGTKTETAVKKAQTKYKLKVDGTVEGSTWQKLLS